MKRLIIIAVQAVIFGLAIYLRVIEVSMKLPDYTHHLMDSILVFVIFVTGAKLVFQIMETLYRRKDPHTDPKKDNFILGLQNIYYIVVGLAFILLLIGFFGIDFKTVFTSLSIVAAAIAIVTKDFITEILSGIFLSFSKNIRIDDYVKIGDIKGKILDMGLQKITFLNDDDDILFIPNTKVYNSDIINYTQGNQRRMSIDFQIGIAYVDDIEKLEQDMVENLRAYWGYIEDNSYNLKIVDLTKDYIDLKLQYTLKKIDRNLYREIRKKTARRVLNFVKSRAQVLQAGPQTGNTGTEN